MVTRRESSERSPPPPAPRRRHPRRPRPRPPALTRPAGHAGRGQEPAAREADEPGTSATDWCRVGLLRAPVPPPACRPGPGQPAPRPDAGPPGAAAPRHRNRHARRPRPAGLLRPGPGSLPRPPSPPPPRPASCPRRMRSERPRAAVGSSADLPAAVVRQRAGHRAPRHLAATRGRLAQRGRRDFRRVRGGARRGHKGASALWGATRKNRAEIEPPVTIRVLSEAIGIKANELLRQVDGQMADGHYQHHPRRRHGHHAGHGVGTSW